MLCQIDDRVGNFDQSENEQWELNNYEEFSRKFKRKPSTTDELENYTNQYKYYSNWTLLFNESNPEKIEKRILPTLKSALMNKKGIFDNEAAYEAMGNYVDKVSKLLFQKRGTITGSINTDNTHTISNNKNEQWDKTCVDYFQFVLA